MIGTEVSATEASRSFSRGRTVAIMGPAEDVDPDGERPRRDQAVEALRRRWDQKPIAAEPGTRDEPYERASWTRWKLRLGQAETSERIAGARCEML